MKELKIMVVVLMIGLPIWGVYRYIEAMSPIWQVIAAQQSAIEIDVARHNASVDVIAHAERTQLLTGALSSIGSLAFLLIVGLGALYIWKVYDQRKESWARAVDGTFALQSFSNGQVHWQIDPNRQATGTIGFQIATGALGEFSSAAGADRQLVYNLSVQKTRTAQAITGIDGVRNSAQAKLAAGYYDRPQRPKEYHVIEDEPTQLITQPWQPLTLQDAFNQSTNDCWLLGQNATGACEFSIMDAQHVGILGAQGTGKTKGTATLMMLYALKSQYHVIALDGKGGVDWMRYRNHIEVYPTDYTMIGDQINELYRAYTMRMKALSMAGASDIYELDYQMKPVVVFLEEFGATSDLLRSESNKQHAAVEAMIKEIFRKGRATGIHLVLIDQLMHGWPGVMKANTKGIVAYKIGGQQGAAFNAYKLHELADKGQFWNNGGVYDAWFTKPEAERMLQKLQPSRTKLLTDVQYSVIDDTGDTSINTRGEGKGENYPPKHDTSIDTSHEFTLTSTCLHVVDKIKCPLTANCFTADRHLSYNWYSLCCWNGQRFWLVVGQGREPWPTT